ncbi:MULTISPECIES: pantoate--beta-alanine ligase [unclassified Dietzia]|uniref:pantoate--beta-alanine ligase n=1 Tax=unclassified Dietzia TaxID=2617939 RepID=UPI000D210C78|nr:MULTISPECIES: pantoate--beta-alanine ligase [unclassified Dietzia]AVZ38569.1 pantoate--beta-alanine ligase [Dietzia sp. JS16-p6b]QGW23643.1 pantoate--beta-alanine ligase [Dietzia sp. DQ12-45-1b]
MTASTLPVRTAVPGRPGTGYNRGELTIHHEPESLHAVTRSLRKVGRQITFVPTMGALHEGHLALVEAARRTPGSVVVVSIFVNPLQFGPGEDLDAYPRTLDEDVARLAAAGVELVLAPSAAAMYPNGPRTTVLPGPAGDILDGAARPGHFAGMLTVVAKLFNIVAPHQAFFGEKDYQQLVLIRQMVADLDMDVRVVGVPTVRESDGLAMSSRNRYLSEDERELATTLNAALVAGTFAAKGGRQAVLDAARAVLAERPQISVDYLELRAGDLGEPPEEGPGRLLVAARIGSARLIDNVGVAIGTGFLAAAEATVAAQQAELAADLKEGL